MCNPSSSRKSILNRRSHHLWDSVAPCVYRIAPSGNDPLLPNRTVEFSARYHVFMVAIHSLKFGWPHIVCNMPAGCSRGPCRCLPMYSDVTRFPRYSPPFYSVYTTDCQLREPLYSMRLFSYAAVVGAITSLATARPTASRQPQSHMAASEPSKHLRPLLEKRQQFSQGQPISAQGNGAPTLGIAVPLLCLLCIV